MKKKERRKKGKKEPKRRRWCSKDYAGPPSIEEVGRRKFIYINNI